MGIINEALTIIRSDLDMYQSRALHYRMKAAEFGVESAMAAVGQAEAGAGAAKLTVDGWQAVEQHLHLETRRAALASVQAALEQKTQAARPLQEKVDQARAHLAGALHRELASLGEGGVHDQTKFGIQASLKYCLIRLDR